MAEEARLVSDRAAFVELLRRELIGPVGGEHEELDGSPLDRYLAGVLYPRNTEAREVENEEDAAPSAAGSRSEEDADHDNPISLAFERLPASLGLSFFVEGGDALNCTVRGACYEEGESDRWHRVPLDGGSGGEVVLLARPGLGRQEVSVPVLQGRGMLHALWRARGKGWLITVTLMNAGSSAGRPDASECLFQVGFSCVPKVGAVSDYPRLREVSFDAEEDELDLQFRDRRTYAVGHGCAAEWSQGEGRVTVCTTAVPEVQTYPVTTELAEGDGQAGERSDVLRLGYLADAAVPAVELGARLGRFIDGFERWTVQLGSNNAALAPQYRAAADRVLSRLAESLARMRQGAALLTSDTAARECFALANRVMLMQMVHSGKEYGGEQRDRDAKAFVEPGYAGPEVDGYRWRPFQLAFQLLAIESVVNEQSAHRETVDLIWFPTGGGKTEAYLCLAAFEMFYRRRRWGAKGGGTAVIKRYTLRLLTAQQFQRAATLICACERVRKVMKLGGEAFRLGLWIGSHSTANTFQDAKKQYEELRATMEPENTFQLQRCPWCGTGIVPERQQDDAGHYGVRAGDLSFDFFCPSSTCPFHDSLPISVVDEDLYQRPPTMLIGTIDKFARLAWDDRAGALLGGGDRRPPGLIIQDEMHLISGPLGTIAGVYEAAIDTLITHRGGRPKIIAATATIRRAKEQGERLYARDIAVFPAPGLDADDSYFARVDRSKPGRLYLGVMGQGHTPVTALVRTAAAATQIPVELNTLSDLARDGYMTLLMYHNSKRELGKSMTLARDDIPARAKTIATDERRVRDIDTVEELSANLSGRRIPEVLAQLERSAGEEGCIDILPCTNMISVGVDVKRLGLMMVVGQPKTTAEYIQASSRVGRSKVPGLVITMYSASKPRDRSHYEGFRPYHESLYRWVEPTSVTPFALPSRERALHAALVIVARHAGGLRDNDDARKFDRTEPVMAGLIEALRARVVRAEPEERTATEQHLTRLLGEWASRVESARKGAIGPLVFDGRNGPQFSPLLCTFDDPMPDAWKTLHSMRHVDSECLIQVWGEQGGAQ